MEDNIKRRLSGIFSKLSTDKKGLSEILASKKELISGLSEQEKEQLIQRFLSLDTDEIDKKLKNFDKESIKNITADDIKKKLR